MTSPAEQTQEKLLQFPCKFPIKVMGLRTDNFANTVCEIVSQYDKNFDPTTLEMKVSSKGHYLAVSVIIEALSQKQLDDIYQALTSHPLVKIVL